MISHPAVEKRFQLSLDEDASDDGIGVELINPQVEASLLPPGEGGAQRRMRAGERLASGFHHKLMIHALIRPRIKYGAGSPGTFSQREKEIRSTASLVQQQSAPRSHPTLPGA